MPAGIVPPVAKHDSRLHGLEDQAVIVLDGLRRPAPLLHRFDPVGQVPVVALVDRNMIDDICDVQFQHRLVRVDSPDGRAHKKVDVFLNH
ncbi:hypothetical protein ACFVWT_08370 [Arthrobacter sp. NPDC058288]|uniref:hypothetical protein n=1 Tax=Arthrobacter sp. NPDC058288 TaxID=3346424 RepID=UPI0036E93F01